MLGVDEHIYALSSLIWGANWQTPLAGALGVSPRTVRRRVQEGGPWTREDMEALLRVAGEHSGEIQAAVESAAAEMMEEP